MFRRNFRSNKKAQVLGLPMYLIIVMIVAVAVIAAVIFMIPQGTRTLQASVTSNFLISAGEADSAEITLSSTDVIVHVTTNDENAQPVSGAQVILSGANTTASGITDASGSITLSLEPTLPANVNEVYVKLVVKATGYEDYEDDQAVMITRD